MHKKKWKVGGAFRIWILAKTKQKQQKQKQKEKKNIYIHDQVNSCTQKTCTMNNLFSSLIVRKTKTKQTNKLFTWLYALAAPELHKNSELLITNSNSEQNSFNVNQSTILSFLFIWKFLEVHQTLQPKAQDPQW